MKLREIIGLRREGMVLDGEVEIDGKYVWPENKAARIRPKRCD
jgi:hypothetical protein